MITFRTLIRIRGPIEPLFVDPGIFHDVWIERSNLCKSLDERGFVFGEYYRGGIFDYRLWISLSFFYRMRQRIACYFVIIDDRFFLSFRFSMRVGPGPNLKTSLIEKRTNYQIDNKSSRRQILNQTPLSRKIDQEIRISRKITIIFANIHSLPFDTERKRRNVYIYIYIRIFQA